MQKFNVAKKVKMGLTSNKNSKIESLSDRLKEEVEDAFHSSLQIAERSKKEYRIILNKLIKMCYESKDIVETALEIVNDIKKRQSKDPEESWKYIKELLITTSTATNSELFESLLLISNKTELKFLKHTRNNHITEIIEYSRYYPSTQSIEVVKEIFTQLAYIKKLKGLIFYKKSVDKLKEKIKNIKEKHQLTSLDFSTNEPKEDQTKLLKALSFILKSIKHVKNEEELTNLLSLIEKIEETEFREINSNDVDSYLFYKTLTNK